MEARLEQQLCVIENSGGAYVWHAPLPEWPSPVVNNEPRPHVVTCSCNKLALHTVINPYQHQTYCMGRHDNIVK